MMKRTRLWTTTLALLAITALAAGQPEDYGAINPSQADAQAFIDGVAAETTAVGISWDEANAFDGTLDLGSLRLVGDDGVGDTWIGDATLNVTGDYLLGGQNRVNISGTNVLTGSKALDINRQVFIWAPQNYTGGTYINSVLGMGDPDAAGTGPITVNDGEITLVGANGSISNSTLSNITWTADSFLTVDSRNGLHASDDRLADDAVVDFGGVNMAFLQIIGDASTTGSDTMETIGEYRFGPSSEIRMWDRANSLDQSVQLNMTDLTRSGKGTVAIVGSQPWAPVKGELGTDFVVKVSNAPAMTNDMVAPYIWSGKRRTFMKYDQTNGLVEAEFDTDTWGAANIVDVTSGDLDGDTVEAHAVRLSTATTNGTVNVGSGGIIVNDNGTHEANFSTSGEMIILVWHGSHGRFEGNLSATDLTLATGQYGGSVDVRLGGDNTISGTITAGLPVRVQSEGALGGADVRVLEGASVTIDTGDSVVSVGGLEILTDPADRHNGQFQINRKSDSDGLMPTIVETEAELSAIEQYLSDGLITYDAPEDGEAFVALSSGGMTRFGLTIGGDANLDGAVDIADLGILAGNWKSQSGSWATADFDGDGVVNVSDLGILAGNWKGGIPQELAPMVVPEPMTMSLLGLGGLALIRRRRTS
jgi:hypothetical protein